jgi:hypothetical protein
MPLYEDVDPDAKRENTPEEQAIADATVALAVTLIFVSKIVTEENQKARILSDYRDLIAATGRFVDKEDLNALSNFADSNVVISKDLQKGIGPDYVISVGAAFLSAVDRMGDKEESKEIRSMAAHATLTAGSSLLHHKLG